MDNKTEIAARVSSAGIRISASTKIMSCLMAAAVMLPSVLISGCGKKESTAPEIVMPPEAITEDMPWYNGKAIDVEEELNSDEYENRYTDLCAVTDEYIIWTTSGTIISDDDTYGDDYAISIMSVFDLEGNKLYEVDTGELIKPYFADSANAHVEKTYIENGMLAIEATQWTGGDSIIQKLFFDLSLREIVSCEELSQEEYLQFRGHTTYDVDGWKLTPVANYEGAYPSGWRIRLESPEGACSEIRFQEQLPDVSFVDLLGFIYLGDHKVIFNTTDFSLKSSGRILLDMESGTMSDIEGDRNYTWLSELQNAFRFQYYEGVGNIASDADGIKIINFTDRCEELYLSFNDCDINRSDISQLNILSMTADHIVMGGSVFRYVEADGVISGGRYDSGIMVILDRADTNPHAGDTVLTAAIVDNLTYPMAEAIRIYNKEDNGTLILADPRYRYSTVMMEVERTEDMDRNSYDLAVRSAIMTKLSIDMMAGDAPDIIINAMDYAWLNRSDLLLDLSADIPDALIYDNIVGLSMTGDDLYQMPLSFTLDGLLVKREDVDTSVPGFSYDAYREYVAGPLNGTDDTQMTRLEFTDTCIEQLGSRIYSNGQYDFGSDDFRQMASFVNDLILPDDSASDTHVEIFSDGTLSEENPPSYIYVSSPYDLLEQTQGLVEDRIMYGFPSAEPSGLIVNINQSVAISSATDAPDKCHDFVSSLCGSDYQDLFAASYGLPVNRDSLIQACIDECDRYNAYLRITRTIIEEYGFEDDEGPLVDGDPDQLFEIIDGYISSASGIRAVDPTVLIIVREEIQAYYAGQKTIDEITGIIQDRVNTLVEERG